MNAEVKFYWSLFLKRLPVMAVIFVLCSAVGVGLALTLPSRYVADARLLVEGAQIPDELAASTVQTGAAEQLQIIEQRLMTRANLIDIANRFRVFENSGRMNPDVVVNSMRDLTNITTTAGRDRATLMTISFKANNPKVAADVVNEFVTLVRSSDAVRRQGLAGQTLDFFEEEVRRLSEILSRKSSAIVAFQEANKDALPEGLEYRLDRQSQLQERVNLAARDTASLNEQRNRLLAVGSTATSQTVQLTPEQQQLRALRSELNGALTIYSEDNPKVKLLRARLDQLENAVGSDGQTVTVDDPAKRVLELQLAEVDSRIEFIRNEVARSEEELQSLRESIEKTPENAIALEALQRDYQNTQSQYNAAVGSLGKAQTGERIEVLSKGERISIIEQAIPPSEPNSPNRKVIAGGGVLLGTVLAGSFFLLMELMNRTIRRPVDLIRGIGVQPLVTIPYLETTQVRRRRRAFITIIIVGLAIAVPVALWAVHVFFMPLDLFVDKVLNKFGIN